MEFDLFNQLLASAGMSFDALDVNLQQVNR
jgi:hypothetical protein